MKERERREFMTLSIDTLTVIASFVSLSDLCSFRSVCSDWNYTIELFINNDDHHNHNNNNNINNINNNNNHSIDDRNNNHVKGLFWIGKYESYLSNQVEKIKELFNVDDFSDGFQKYTDDYFYFRVEIKLYDKLDKLKNKIVKKNSFVTNFDQNQLRNLIDWNNTSNITKFINNIVNKPKKVIEYIEKLDLTFSNTTNLIYSKQFYENCLANERFFRNVLIYFNNHFANAPSPELLNFIVVNYLNNEKLQKNLMKNLVTYKFDCSVKLCELLTYANDKSFDLPPHTLEYMEIFLLKSIFIGNDECEKLKNLLVQKCKYYPGFLFNEEVFKNILNLINVKNQKVTNNSFLDIVQASILFNVDIMDYLEYCIEIFKSPSLQFQATDYLFKHKFNSNLQKMDEYFHTKIPYSLNMQLRGIQDYYLDELHGDMFKKINNTHNCMINFLKQPDSKWSFYHLAYCMLQKHKDQYFIATGDTHTYLKRDTIAYTLNFELLMENVELNDQERMIVERNIVEIRKICNFYR